MKLDAGGLKKLIKTIVVEELESQLPRLIKEHLADQYIRKIVSESQKRVGSISEIMDADESEEIPSPKKSVDRGIYNPGSNTRDDGGLDEARKILKKDNPFGFVFDDVKPLGESESVVDTKPLAESVNFSSFIDAMENDAQNKKQIPVSYESKMRELEQRRKALDVPVSQIKR